MKHEVTEATLKESQVYTQIALTGRELEILEENIDDLENRLGDILRECEDTKGNSDDDIALVPLALNVRVFYKRMVGLNNKISDIINRLEI